MSLLESRGKSGYNDGITRHKTRMRSGRFRYALIAVLLTCLGLSSCDSAKDTKAAPGLSATVAGGETRPTLSPANYTGITADAYRAAQEIPQVLDKLYCYCDCEKHFGHKSLLSCFVDEHAVHCDICMHEAIMAHDLHKQGFDEAAIRKAIDERFAHLSHEHKD